MPRATFNAQVSRARFYSRPPTEENRCTGQADMRLLRYKPLKGVTTAGRPAAHTDFSLLFSKTQAGATAPARNYYRHKGHAHYEGP